MAFPLQYDYQVIYSKEEDILITHQRHIWVISLNNTLSFSGSKEMPATLSATASSYIVVAISDGLNHEKGSSLLRTIDLR